MTQTLRYGRILLKASGEVLAGGRGQGLDAAALDRMADELAAAAALGVQLGVVIGGGNILRGGSGTGLAFERTRGDRMGMLATVINAMAMEDALLRRGTPARVLTSTPMRPLAASYSVEEARATLDQGVVALLAGGTGHPFFSTDTAAALRALEIGAEALFKGTKVDGVYDKDPARHPDARRFAQITHQDALERRLGVMDLTALSLCSEHALPILVFDLTSPGALCRVLQGEALASLVSSPPGR